MATTDLDGTNLMLLREGTQVTLVLGDKSYMGTLKMRTEGTQEYWYIALNDGGEIEIHKRTGAVEIVTPAEETEGTEGGPYARHPKYPPGGDNE